MGEQFFAMMMEYRHVNQFYS